MQKIIVSVLLVALSSLGLVWVGSSSAQAANCPYTGCVDTRSRINGPSQHKAGRVSFRVRVTALSGTARPKGHVVVTCEGPGNTKSKTRSYNRHPIHVSFYLGAKGYWHCMVKFSSNGKFKSSRNRTTVRIV